ncbi:MAG: type II toxin-antitoxin system ParD family antitoxin [Methylobacteriaceae bacterium]|nr:type II toxin-antitoxin system ParD family antitoxin [Methylobacteriaceae bacterium]
MPNFDLGQHYEDFVQEQIAQGRFQNASEVIRAGLRMLEDRETGLSERRAELKSQINQAFDDPQPSVPASEVFSSIESKHKAAMKAARREA